MKPDSLEMAAKLRSAIGRLRETGVGMADPADAAALIGLLRALHDTGRRDLPLGRLLEGHVDAVQIVSRYGTAGQVDALRVAIADGAMLGVWNAALPDTPLILAEGRLNGGKSYASGAGILTHAVTNAETPDGPCLLLLPLSPDAPVIDRDWWVTIGMQASATHIVRWHDGPILDDHRIGRPHDYAREPWFSGGALRFVAVHAGGIAGLFDQTRDHLNAAGRADDPHQAARLAALFGLAQAAADAVLATATRWFDEPDSVRLPLVAATRLSVAEAATRAIAIAQEAVGLPAMFVSHPLSALMADLSVYLRQPAPDAQRMRVAAAAASGALTPTL